MADTYTQLYIQIVFAVKCREALIREAFREDLQKYITGIASNKGHKMLAIYCMPDHTHVFVGLNPNQSISSLANDLKSNSSRWINQQNFCPFQFNWQNGYGAFSYHQSMISTICNYIHTQKEHHQKKQFREEYLDLLRYFNVDYNDQYLFDFFDE